MRGPRLAPWLAFTLLALGTGAAHAQSAPAAPPWERWFAALNAGDVAGVVGLMRTEVEEDGILVPRCAGGCVGMAVMEASIAAMVADGYRGEVVPASVQVLGGMVSFDVAETAGAPPHQATSTTRWMMELDGDLIAPACEGGCLESPVARAARRAAQPGPAAATVAPPAPVLPRADAPRRPLAAPPPAAGVAGPTPAGWLLAGLMAGLLALAASAGLDGWRRIRGAPPADRP